MAVYLTEVVTDLAMPPQQRPIPHQFAMGDNNAYTITALLCDSRNPDAELLDGTVGGELVRPDGVTVALAGEKGDAVRQVNLAAGGLCNATPCSVTLPQACFAVPGRVTLTIKLTDGTTITQALSVSAVVVRTSTDEAVDPGEVIPDLAAIQAAAAEALDAADDARTAASSAVRYDTAQSLTPAQQAQARTNAGAADVAEFDAVAYPLDVEMLTSADEAVRVLSGGINTSGGDLNSGTRARTQYFRVQSGHRYMFSLNNAEFVVMSAWEYNGTSQSTVIGRVSPSGYTTSRFAFTASGKFARIAFAHADTSVAITDDDKAAILAALSLKETASDNLAPVDNPTATDTHAAGSLLTVSGQLYKATQAIATGETITPGTNVDATTVAAQLAERDTAIAAETAARGTAIAATDDSVSRNAYAISGATGLVDYNPVSRTLAPGDNDVTAVGVDRAGVRFTLNGTTRAGSGVTWYCRLSGNLSRATAITSQLNSIENSFNMIQGHRYKLALRRVSGSVTTDAPEKAPYLTLYVAGTGNLEALAPVTRVDDSVALRYATHNNGSVVLWLCAYGGTTFTNAVYEAVVIDTDAEQAFPTAPTADGDYTLKVTVTNGVPAYSWIAT